MIYAPTLKTGYSRSPSRPAAGPTAESRPTPESREATTVPPPGSRGNSPLSKQGTAGHQVAKRQAQQQSRPTPESREATTVPPPDSRGNSPLSKRGTAGHQVAQRQAQQQRAERQQQSRLRIYTAEATVPCSTHTLKTRLFQWPIRFEYRIRGSKGHLGLESLPRLSRSARLLPRQRQLAGVGAVPLALPQFSKKGGFPRLCFWMFSEGG